MNTIRVTISLATAAALTVGLTACSPAGEDATEAPRRLVLADRDTKDNYHPASGYGQTGVSPVYDGLLRPAPSNGSDVLPVLEPALAAESPTHNAAASEWTVKLRPGVTFHDGSSLDAEDVKATYAAATDTTRGSKIVARYDIIKQVEVVDAATVKFHLAYPTLGFASRLTLAIAPSELVSQGTVAEGPLSSTPVGTGPYRMVENKADRVVYEANKTYWNGEPEVGELVVITSSDDTARGNLVATGEIDGAALPPALAQTFAGRDAVTVHSVPTMDWKGISLPDDPDLADARVRRAMNLAVDRDAVVAGPLKGHGRPLDNLVNKVYGPAWDPNLTFPHDVAAAEKLLDEAGWVKGADGMRAKNGQKFSVTLMYAGSDSLRRDLAIDFAAQMKRIGLDFPTKAGTWDEITPALPTVAAVLGGGSSPWDIDLLVYGEYHTRTASSTDYNNPGNHGSARMDEALEAARHEVHPAKRNAAYREVQKRYLDDPSYVFLACPDHTYVERPNTWKKGELILEPHVHGSTWGPWWNLRSWTQ